MGRICGLALGVTARVTLMIRSPKIYDVGCARSQNMARAARSQRARTLQQIRRNAPAPGLGFTNDLGVHARWVRVRSGMLPLVNQPIATRRV